jgi:hypothetical protein
MRYGVEAFDNDWFHYSNEFDTRSVNIRQRSCSLTSQIQPAHGVEHALCSYS